MPGDRWLEDRLRAIQEGMKAHEIEDNSRFSMLSSTLAGIGTEGTPLAIRLDRLEQRQKDRSRLMWAVLAVALALLGERLAAHMRGDEPKTPAVHGGS